MKILARGQPQYPAWWHGLIVTCDKCGRKVQLEAGDEQGDEMMIHSAGVVEINCANCKDMIWVYRDSSPTV